MLVEMVFDVDVSELKPEFRERPEAVAMVMAGELEDEGYGSPESAIVSVRVLPEKE
jgi:hypothetical protein